jgi:hypothetical protein
MHRPDRSAKPVTKAALGLDQFWPRWICFDLASQAQYLHVDGTFVDICAAQSRELE